LADRGRVIGLPGLQVGVDPAAERGRGEGLLGRRVGPHAGDPPFAEAEDVGDLDLPRGAVEKVAVEAVDDDDLRPHPGRDRLRGQVLPARPRGLEVLGDGGRPGPAAAVLEGDRLDPFDLRVHVADRGGGVAAGEGLVGGEDDLDLGIRLRHPLKLARAK
jgi:hypothetical protein